MYFWIFAFLLGLSGASLAQSLPPPVPLTPSASAAGNAPAGPQAAAPTPAERSLTERAGAAVGKAAEETTSAFGRAMNWTGRQLEGAGQWTARQGENIASDKPETAAAPAQHLPPPVPLR